jgi:hypothetical protein
MVDSCPSHGSEDEVYEMLMHNFKRHYNTNRAPFGLYFHTIWFKKRINLRAFQVTPPIDKKTQSSSQQFILILSPPPLDVAISRGNDPDAGRLDR